MAKFEPDSPTEKPPKKPRFEPERPGPGHVRVFQPGEKDYDPSPPRPPKPQWTKD